MKMSAPKSKLLTGMGLAAGLFLGCQNILDQSNTGDASASPSDAADASALRLSIKDDSTCREEWTRILSNRSDGHPDTTAEAGFVADCVKEVKVTDKGIPVIPPGLVPDARTRCHWIASQIEGGRDSMVVTFKQYCPDDCRKLEMDDSSKHETLCHEPGKGPIKEPRDTLPKPPHHDSDDTLVKPPHHDSDDTLVKPPHHDGDDSMPKPPLPRPDGDTLKEPPHSGPADDTCALLHAKLEIVKPGEAGRADLEHAFAAICKEPLPKPPVVTPPSAVNCDELRKKLTALDPASPDAVRLKVTLEGHCPEVPAAK